MTTDVRGGSQQQAGSASFELEPHVESGTRRGLVGVGGVDRVIHGDAAEVLASLPDKSIDCIITDPPYATSTAEWDREPDAAVWAEMQRVCKTPIAVFGYAKNLMGWHRHFDRLQLLAFIVWHKYNEEVPSMGLTRTHQDIAIWGKSIKQVKAHEVRDPYTSRPDLAEKWFNGPSKGGDEFGSRMREKGRATPHADGKRCGDLWAIPAEFAKFNAGRRDHPNQKPMAVMRRLVQLLTSPGDVILDCYAGSGSTLVAAKELGRRFVGVERDPKYFASCNRRLAQDALPLLGGGGAEQVGDGNAETRSGAGSQNDKLRDGAPETPASQINATAPFSGAHG